MNSQKHITIPRNRVFVLVDGTFVVQWETNQVQNLLNGKYRSYTRNLFGSAITDYELNQLKRAGVIESFDLDTVYLRSLPDYNETIASRSFYLNTTLPKSEMELIRSALLKEKLIDQYSVRIRDNFVVIWSENGTAFKWFEDAEAAREILSSRLPELLGGTVVAFIEIESD